MVTPSRNWPHLEVQDTKRVGYRYPATAPASVWQQCAAEAAGCQMIPYIFIWQEQCDGDNRSGRPSSLMTEVNTAHIKEIIHTDRRASMWHMAPDFELRYSTVQYIMVGVLQYHKVCIRWVPCALIDMKNMTKIMASLFPTTLCS
jgi:hypothetical protein